FFHSPRSPVLMDFFPFIRHGTFLVKVGHLLSLERYSTRAPLLLRRRRHTAPPMPRGDPSRKTPRRRELKPDQPVGRPAPLLRTGAIQRGGFLLKPALLLTGGHPPPAARYPLSDAASFRPALCL